MKRLFVLLILLSITLYSFLFGFKKITREKVIEGKEDYKSIITVWQIDTFEGGKGSRKQFLERIAKQCEKQNEGLYFLVTDYTVEGAKEKLSKGIFPDIISFGLGVEVDGLKELKDIKTVKGCKINGKTYLTAWCKGKYCLFKNNKKTKKKDFYSKIVVSKMDYTNPLTALSLYNQKFASFSVKSSLDAYMDFVSENCEYLLGTQRDIERLKVREMEAEIIPLNNFSDLYQYIGILTNDENKYNFALEFLKLLTSEETQKKLKDISMFSPFLNNIYEDDKLCVLEKEKETYTLSPFLGKENINDLQNESLDFINGKGDLNKIKNILI